MNFFSRTTLLFFSIILFASCDIDSNNQSLNKNSARPYLSTSSTTDYRSLSHENTPLTSAENLPPSRIYYVDKNSVNALDSNPGTLNLPLKSISQALKIVAAGEAVVVKAGIYTGPIEIKKSGIKNRPVTLKAFPGDEQKVIIKDDGIKIKGQSYIYVSGMKIEDARDIGIYIEGPGTDITITGNHTYNTVSSGIAAWGVPWKDDPNKYHFQGIKALIIENNKIELANNGGWNEQITLANGVDGFEIRYNEITTGGNPIHGGEGIDIKEGCSNGKVHHNKIYNINRLGIYVDAGGLLDYPVPPTQNIEIYNNTVRHVDGEGISLTTEGKADLKNILVYDNLIEGVTKNGIVVYKHPAGSGLAEDIVIANNTTHKNGRSGIRIDFPGAKNLQVMNNTSLLNHDSQISIAEGSQALTQSNRVKN